MAISARTVKSKRNASGVLTGKAGTVYDVNIKYKSDGRVKTYSRKGFPTKREALEHESEMKAKLTNPTYVPPTAANRKMTVKEYMTDWLERYAPTNLRPNTESSYRSFMKNHIFPNIGDVLLCQLSPATLDELYRKLAEKGLSPTSVKYTHRIINVSMENARKYHYIEINPARDIMTRFGKQGETPAPYTVEQMRRLLADVTGTPWELIIILGGLYGLRISEILGLRWRNVDLEGKKFSVVEQLPSQLPPNTRIISEMAPVKAGVRDLPITDQILPYFERHRQLQEEQKNLLTATGSAYYANDLVIAKSDGTPERREHISRNFGQLLRRQELPHIRFHDLRHTFATMALQNGVDIKTVSNMLGHYDAGFTLRTYTHATRQKQDEAAQTMGNFMERVR